MSEPKVDIESLEGALAELKELVEREADDFDLWIEPILGLNLVIEKRYGGGLWELKFHPECDILHLRLLSPSGERFCGLRDALEVRSVGCDPHTGEEGPEYLVPLQPVATIRLYMLQTVTYWLGVSRVPAAPPVPPDLDAAADIWNQYSVEKTKKEWKQILNLNTKSGAETWKRWTRPNKHGKTELRTKDKDGLVTAKKCRCHLGDLEAKLKEKKAAAHSALIFKEV